MSGGGVFILLDRVEIEREKDYRTIQLVVSRVKERKSCDTSCTHFYLPLQKSRLVTSLVAKSEHHQANALHDHSGVMTISEKGISMSNMILMLACYFYEFYFTLV